MHPLLIYGEFDITIFTEEVYSNPIAPAEDERSVYNAMYVLDYTVSRSAVLTNDDFRKLLNTPRVAAAASAPNTTAKVTRSGVLLMQ